MHKGTDIIDQVLVVIVYLEESKWLFVSGVSLVNDAYVLFIKLMESVRGI